MTVPRNPAQLDPDNESADASLPLDTDAGREDADRVGGEHDGPIKAPDAQDGAYVIP